MGSTADLAAALKLASEGRLEPVISEILPLSQAARAHELMESRKVLGKVVLSMERP